MSLLFLNLITSIPDLITKTVETNPNIAYFVISLAMFLENLIPPIPSEIIMPLGGFFVYKGDLNFYILIISGLIGTVIGALPWYFLGKLLNEKKLSNFIDRKGKFVGISLQEYLDETGDDFNYFIPKIRKIYNNFVKLGYYHNDLRLKNIIINPDMRLLCIKIDS